MPALAGMVECSCKRIALESLGRGRWGARYDTIGDYMLVDKDGKEIVDEKIENPASEALESTNDNEPYLDSPGRNKMIVDDLMTGLKLQYESIQNLSTAGRFAPCINQDLAALQMLLHPLLAALSRQLDALSAFVGADERKGLQGDVLAQSLRLTELEVTSSHLSKELEKLEQEQEQS